MPPRRIRRYLVLSWHLSRAGYLTSSRDRASFSIGIAANVLRKSVQIALIAVVLARFQVLRGWDLPAIALLIGLRSMAHGVFVFFFHPVRRIPNRIRAGDLDRMFLRPMSVLYQAAYGGTVGLIGAGDFAVGLGYFIFAAYGLHIRWDAALALFTVVTVLSGVAIEFGVYLLSGVVAFWTLQDSPMYALAFMFLEELPLYPVSMYNDVLQFAMSWVLPVAFINFFPAALFFARSTLPMPAGLGVRSALLTPLVALLLLAAAGVLWKLAEARYQSTGS